MPALDITWSRCLLTELLQTCSSTVCFAPGNRSQPLIRALLELRQERPLRLLSHWDERGLAFAAMGLAHAERKPVILVTTSGTAVANLLPGLVEARIQRLPIIVLTADRPPEAHFRGSHQTWPQPPLLAGAVVRCEELPCPTITISPVTLREKVQSLLRDANEGPVQINCPFKEPFHGEPLEEAQAWLSPPSPLGLDQNKSPILRQTEEALLERLRKAKRPLVTLGAHWDAVDSSLIDEFHRQGAVVIPDLLSQWRLRSHPALMRDTDPMYRRLPAEMAPDLWFHLGGPLLSKQLLLWLQRHAPPTMVVQAGVQHWDPAFVNPQRFHCDPAVLRFTSGDGSVEEIASTSWQRAWQELARQAPSLEGPPSDEALAACAMLDQLPSDGLLFIGNSMPVRHLARWAAPREDAPRIWANRGASGIDGNIATALGWSWSSSSPLGICVGDLTAIHDLNSISMIRYARGPVLLQILNNHGGDIFRKVAAPDLPPAWLEEGWITPHTYDFEHAAALFGWGYGQEPPQTLQAGQGYLWEPSLNASHMACT